MAKTIQEIREQLSEIEPTEDTYAGLGPDDVDSLTEIAQDDQDWLAARAVNALARVHSPRAAEAVVEACRDPRREVRSAAASAARVMPAAAADAVVSLLIDDSDASVRKFAVGAVSALSGDDLVARVAEVARVDGSPRIRQAAQAAVDAART